jgi:hypothetical protein
MANRQPLQEPTLAGLTIPFTGPVFIELTARRFEHGRVNQGWFRIASRCRRRKCARCGVAHVA